MATKEEAQAFLMELRSCRPSAFFGKLDESQRGMSFVLFYLAEAKETVIAGDLARQMNVSTARIAALLRKMEQNGLITRKGAPDDARKTVVEITPEGSAQAEQLRQHILEKTALLIDRVGTDDLQEFIRISRRMKAALDV